MICLGGLQAMRRYLAKVKVVAGVLMRCLCVDGLQATRRYLAKVKVVDGVVLT